MIYSAIKPRITRNFKSLYLLFHCHIRHKCDFNIPVIQHALRYEDRVAINDQNGKHTYRQLYFRSLNLSKSLQNVIKTNVQERVAFLCPNDVSYIISLWATWMAGHVAVPLYHKDPSSRLGYFVKDSASSVVISTIDLFDSIKPVLSSQQTVILLGESLLNDDKDLNMNDASDNKMKCSSAIPSSSSVTSDSDVKLINELQSNFNNNNDAMIIYTSGTTGPPKGVVLTHKNLTSQIECLHNAWKFTMEDDILHCLPLHHTHGIVNALLLPLYSGSRITMLPEFDTTEVWRHLLNIDDPIKDRVNVFMAVPTIYVKLIEEYNSKHGNCTTMAQHVKSTCLQNMRLMVCGSSALHESVISRWYDITGHTLLERYGMTEIGMALSNPLEGMRKPGFVGTPLPGVEVCIVKFNTNEDNYNVVCVGSHIETKVMKQVGELLVKGPNVFKQYWRKPDETTKEFTSDGWFRTGDTAQYMHGSYKILGRTSVDIIKTSGYKVSALDIERVYLAHSSIKDIAVVGIPDSTLGQKIVALVVWSGSELNVERLKKWSFMKLPHYEIPKTFKVIPGQIPRNSMGKINKKQLIKDFF